MALLTPAETRWVVGVVAVILLLASVSFVLTPVSGEQLQPVNYEDTVDMGGTGVDLRRAEAEGFVLPRSEVFFSGYRYVVGYGGVDTAASELADPSTRRQFGRPLAVYVSDFSTISPTLSEDGFVVPEQGRAVGWTAAESAHFVVGSEARVPSGPAVLPFSKRQDATQFAAANGGDVVDWKTLQSRVGDPLQNRLARFEREETTRRTWANETVATADERLDRPRSVVVGEDAPTVAAAVEAAPANTTVFLPAGTYRVDSVVVNRSVTIAGAGPQTVIRGDGNGTVFHLRADGAAVTDLRITGVGDVGSRGFDRRNETLNWDTTVQLAYGYGDAAIVLDDADRGVVADVTIDTPASGVIVRHSNESVLRNLTVNGADTASEGFMGAILIGARSVVEESTFYDGRDGVYTHRADGSVVRENQFAPGRYGVHEMYTSETLVTDNVVRDAQMGIIVMTRPTNNLIVGNEVRDSEFGIVPAGGDSYYAENVVVGNEYGLQVAGDRNTFAANVVVGNDVGLRATDILPSNWVVRNDVVANARRVASNLGPLRTWTHHGVGNYWGALPLPDADGDGVYDRAYQPSGSVDARLGETPGTTTLAQSPAAATLRRVRDVVSGLRQTGVVDTAARTRPFDPEAVVEAMNATETTNSTVIDAADTSQQTGGASA
ncbi:nitrous oxidase accessory protein [Halogeometricum borinquense DSM 11551]|uniref:Nitrous oxidase accessory protein n=1 Tax=Halogeometricum borinquense (strain ATCC 700274 / DSM 11551 / JCM 10706 / KCTC 4070 / PR3) TaxID=469382 RepID=E4NQU2_HALBP|nr:NosD domain-containing protein [Halogeometricum borinquense]ADQ67889.1 nitrous oxidase accessory protein [Halogeometricum borinquense DSM 11551]ELY24191.1 nitrous oxidase accessory protein [Halogeometricum borinquense DSM 11551]